MDFFAHHGIIFLLLLVVFPRLTLLFSSVASGGLLWWLGWVFTPHLLVAFLALPYWDTNPVLVFIAWVVALSGTFV
jgi:hypothetical protein